MEIEKKIHNQYRKKIWAPFMRGLETYQMVEKGDVIGVAVSGGKDSLLMAKLMQSLVRVYKGEIQVKCIVMDPGYKPEVRRALEANLKALEIEAHLFETQIFDISKDMSSANQSPCFLCARMRRGALYEKAQSLGCNKLALGHHYDDVIETILMNVLCGGEFKTMLPKIAAQNFEEMTLIRPLYLVREADILHFIKNIGIEPMNCGCSVTEKKEESRRAEIKALIKDLSTRFENVEHSIFSASKNVRLDHLLIDKEALDYELKK